MAVALACSACAHGGGEGAPGPGVVRFAIFPMDAEGAPLRDSIAGAFEEEIERAGLDAVGAAEVDPVLARHRVRGPGVDLEAAKLARDELGVEAVVVLTVQRVVTIGEPILTVTARLVSAAEPPLVLWMDGFSRAAARTHGLLGVGGRTMSALEGEAAAALARSLAAFLRTGRPSGRCGAERAFRPHLAFRAPASLAGRRIAVLPFVNRTLNRSAGELVALELVRQLVAGGRFEVIDPGAVREALRKDRLITRGGISTHESERIAKALGADLIVSGEVSEYEDQSSVPKAEFVTLVLDREEHLVWQSLSRGTGDDAVSVFDFGKLGTLGEVICRMAAGVVQGVDAHSGMVLR